MSQDNGLKGIYPDLISVPRSTSQGTISDGSTASYYALPKDAKELQDLIAYRNMNAQLGEIFRAAYRYGLCPHSPRVREIKKIIFYAQAELERLEKYDADEAEKLQARERAPVETR